MEHSPSKKRILCIVEGADTEKKLFSILAERYGLAVEVVSVCANIHMLFRHLEKENFEFNIVDALLELKGVSAEDKAKLIVSSFTYTYLIFDLDLQHYDVSVPKNVERGLAEAKKMAEHFCDETDPTIGKIYINYPMMESYRDCKDFFDDSYRTKVVSVPDFVRYKQIVGSRGLQKNVGQLEMRDFSDLIRMNLYKANDLCRGQWKKPSYREYCDTLTQCDLIKSQTECIRKRGEAAVLNTALFLIVDYFGNRNRFYDEL